MLPETLLALKVLVAGSQGERLPSARCVAASAVQRLPDDAWLWQPGGDGDALRCDASGFEPVDIAPPEEQEGNEPLTVMLAKSRPVKIQGATGSVKVEWKQPSDDGLTLLASRNIAFAEQTRIDLAVAARVLTFIWGDGARVSVYVPPTADEVSVVKPAPRSEVVTWLGMRSVRPVRLQLHSGDRTQHGHFDRAGFAIVAGLTPGEYSGAVTYSGGLAVPLARTITVEPDQTVQIRPADVPAAGALNVVLEPSACHDLLPANVVSVTVQTTDSKEVLHRIDMDGEDCTTLIDGLPPAEYQVGSTVSGWDATPASEPIAIRSDRIDEVVLKPDIPRVEGMALLGERPAAEVSLHFRGAEVERVVQTDRDGRFNISLPKPATYDVNIRSSEYVPGETRVLRVTQGRQTARLVFSPGRLIVTAKSSGGSFAVPVQIHVKGDGYNRTAIATADEFKAEFLGVPPGTYVVSASGIPDWKTRQPKEVVIDDVIPQQDVSLTLERILGRRVILINDAGEPVTGARVQAGVMMLEQQAPGTYDMPPVAGDRLLVRASGYLPVCRDVLQSEGDVTIAMRSGLFTAILRFSEGPGENLGTILGSPGSTCALSVRSLDHQLTTTAAGAELRLNGLPSGQYVYVTPDGKQVVVNVPGDPALVPRR